MQFRQRFFMRYHDEMNDEVWSTSKALGNFRCWFRKTTGFLIAAFGFAFQPVIEWVEDQDNVITNEALYRQFGPTEAEPIECDQEKSEQIHVALLTLTESESFDILRRMIRRWDLVWRKAQSSSTTTLGSRTMQSARLSRRTSEMGRTGPSIREEQTQWNDDNRLA